MPEAQARARLDWSRSQSTPPTSPASRLDGHAQEDRHEEDVHDQLAVALSSSRCCWASGPAPGTTRIPIIFVHGGSGSGAQFASQAMRFTSNGYPSSRIAVLEYDSSAIGTILPDVLAALDALIAELKAETGAAQVDLMGHSLGTTVSHAYLATPERAANVAHYVNIDGRTAAAPPGGVPTLALWAGAVNRPIPPLIVGATNVTIPNQEHVEVATSEESFFEMYHFLQRQGAVHHAHPARAPPADLRARDRLPAEHAGSTAPRSRSGWFDGDTGERIGSQPRETFAIGPDGSFGPFKAWFGLHYELAVVREGEVEHRLLLRAVRAQRPAGAAERGARPRALHPVERREHGA